MACADFYDMFSLSEQPPVVARVCDDIACQTKGADTLCAAFETGFGAASAPDGAGPAKWVRSACLGLCERAPAVLVTGAGEEPWTRVLAPASASDVATVGATGSAGTHDPCPVEASVPQAGDPELRLLRRIRSAGPRSLEDYLRLWRIQGVGAGR